MGCRQLRKALLEDEIKPPTMQEHLRTCASCAAYVHQWEELRAGLRRVAEQESPEPSLGFAHRVVRKAQEPSLTERLSDLPLVRAGRRFVYAALMAALLLVLGILVPASGPVRSPSADIEAAQPETVAAQNYPIFSGRLMENDVEFAPSEGH
jgi:anti-sigma factor RsiW